MGRIQDKDEEIITLYSRLTELSLEKTVLEESNKSLCEEVRSYGSNW